MCMLTASLLEPFCGCVCSVYDTYKLPNAKNLATIIFRGHQNGREPPRRHLSGDDGPPGSVPGRVAESTQVTPWVGFSRPGRVLAAQSKKTLEKIFPWSHTLQTHAPRPPRRRTPQRGGFWAVWRLSFAPSELCSQLKTPVRGGEMGWGEAVEYHRKRLEDEQRARVASWEAGAGSKRPAPTGVARNLENSFCTSMHVRHQTPGSSSSSYQGKM